MSFDLVRCVWRAAASCGTGYFGEHVQEEDHVPVSAAVVTLGSWYQGRRLCLLLLRKVFCSTVSDVCSVFKLCEGAGWPCGRVCTHAMLWLRHLAVVS
jgi:hypothetical protein